MADDPDLRLSALMVRAQAGDRRAYTALLTEVAALVAAFARKRVRPPDACEEIVQDTLLCIHRDRHTYDPARPFRPWMYAIARHRMLDHLARQRRWAHAELLTPAGLEELATSAGPISDTWRALRGALAQLSASQREVIELMKIDGHSVAEIAEQTGMTMSTVKVTAHRGYRKLRALLGGPVR